MDPGAITCPQCGHEFEISDALTGRIREHLRAEMMAEVTRREAELKKSKEALKEQRAQLAKSREEIEEQVEARLKERLSDAEEKAAKKMEEQFALQLKELQGAVEEKDAAIKGFREKELELLKVA